MSDDRHIDFNAFDRQRLRDFERRCIEQAVEISRLKEELAKITHKVRVMEAENWRLRPFPQP